MSDLISTLVDLIDVPSEIGDEGRLCTSLAERLMSTWGMDGVERIGNSLIVGKRSQRPLVLLVGHIDTVPAQGNGPATIEEGRVIGLGASDMKSGLAVMVHLLEDPSVRLGPYDVVGLFYDKEEGPVDDNGLEPVLQRAPWLAEAEFAVVLEPTDLELQVGCIGTINATVRFEGYSGHSARPWLGENAITKAGSWLAELHARLPESITSTAWSSRKSSRSLPLPAASPATLFRPASNSTSTTDLHRIRRSTRRRPTYERWQRRPTASKSLTGRHPGPFREAIPTLSDWPPCRGRPAHQNRPGPTWRVWLSMESPRSTTARAKLPKPIRLPKALRSSTCRWSLRHFSGS